MRLLSVVFCFVTFLSGTTAHAAEYLQILNSYISMKLHLDDSRGQMIGAAWIRVRNNTGAPLTEIPFVLNSGLQVTKVMGSGNSMLRETSTTSPVTGYEFLEVTAGTITLASPVANDKETEVIIHYRGSLQDISWAGIEHAKETLRSGFTIIRADSFGYPLLAKADKKAIAAATSQPAYYQTATVEIPKGYAVAGNLHISDQTDKGANIAFDLKHSKPTAPMILPIARYGLKNDGPVAVSYLPGNESTAASLAGNLTPEINQLQALLGTPSVSTLNIAMVPDGYGTETTTGLIMMEQSNFAADSVKNSGALLSLWGIDDGGTKGHWRHNMDELIKLAAGGGDVKAYGETAYANLKAALAANKAVGKTALEKFADNGWRNEADALISLTFAALYETMGRDAFFAFIRTLRSELRGAYADNTVFADFVAEEIPGKKARKLAKNWLKGKKIGKDMKKTASFEALISRYK